LDNNNMPPPRDIKKSAGISDDEKRVLANRYRVEKKLGSGNYGTAFLVKDLKTNELKVLKEVSVGDMQPDESIESVHEANLLSKLDNPYILKYSDSFLDGEYFCIVTEYCEGGDLDIRFKKLKKERKRLSEELILDWTVQLLTAVNYMHSRRILHRDLKARNIFLKNEMIKIGDFGISRILQGTMDMAQTFTGTPYYMSPEVLKHEGYNSKSDIWSIGCLLYEMCTYEHAFEGQGLMGVMYKIVEGKVPELPNCYSKELNLILKKIFRKDPATRPSAIELLREPFLSNHIKSMIKRLEATKLDDPESTLVIKNDRNEIAKALSAKVSLKDLQAQRQKILPPITATEIVQPDDDDVQIGHGKNTQRPRTSYVSPNFTEKELTPKEKMMLNKLRKADEEGARMSLLAQQNYEERMFRESIRREATFNSSIKHYNPLLNQNKTINYDTIVPSHLNQTRPSRPAKTEIYDSFDEEDEGTLLQTVQHFASSKNQKNKTLPKQTDDSRPIRPLKKRIENAFDDQGIPYDPELTNEYYQNDFEVDESPERKPKSSINSLSKTIGYNRKANTAGPSKRPLNRGALRNQDCSVRNSLAMSNTYGGSTGSNEYSELLNHMQNALLDDRGNETFGDDSKTSVFGSNAKYTKIQNLKKQAKRLLGDSYERVYEYLRENRFGIKRGILDESKIIDGSKELASNPNACFLVDQLLFLEESI
ncbi:Serine threonine- kinase Nek11, partial [Brachionus plicatilis]